MEATATINEKLTEGTNSHFFRPDSRRQCINFQAYFANAIHLAKAHRMSFTSAFRLYACRGRCAAAAARKRNSAVIKHRDVNRVKFHQFFFFAASPRFFVFISFHSKNSISSDVTVARRFSFGERLPQRDKVILTDASAFGVGSVGNLSTKKH